MRPAPRIDDPVYPLSVAARLSGVHERSLMLYERKGLVCRSRRPFQKRLFSQRDIRIVEAILFLTRTQNVHSLEGVRVIFQLVKGYGSREAFPAELEDDLGDLADLLLCGSDGVSNRKSSAPR